jgi:hypothetical protein
MKSYDYSNEPDTSELEAITIAELVYPQLKASKGEF